MHVSRRSRDGQRKLIYLYASISGLKFAEMEMSALLYLLLITNDNTIVIEVVLATLVENFKFSPGRNEIEWHMNDLAVPVIKGSTDITPTLPMRLSLIQPP